MSTKTRAGAVAALLMVTAVALGNPGDLDVTFGTGGRVSLDLGSGQGMTFAAVQQSDGRIVLAGNLFGTRQRVLMRFETNGTLDSSFGNSGIVAGARRDDTAGALVQQVDGKLVVAGIAFLDRDYAALWRYDSDGSIDTTFGTDGGVTLDLGNIHIGNVEGLVQQGDGKLVIAGAASADEEVYMVLARFHANGSLDTSFGSGGIAIIDFADAGVGVLPASLLLQPDGKLVISGWQGQSVAVARVTAAGALDEAFGESGRLVISLETETDPYSWATSAAVQEDGKLVIAGAIGREHPWELEIVATDAFILRLQTDGALDPTFGASGLVTGRQIQAAGFVAVAVQADGRIVAAVHCRQFDSGCDMALTRFNPDGSSDSTFGIGGVSVADFGTLDRPPLSLVDAMIHQSDGNFLIVGSHAVPNSDFPWMLAMARFGRDDTGFPGLIGFTSARKDVDENAGGVEFSVRRTGGSTGAVSVTFQTADESATAGSDYMPQVGRLDWADGESSTKAITLTLIDDAEGEENGESFRLALSDPSGGAMLTVSDATIAIADDESSPIPAPIPPPVESGGGAGSGLWLCLVLLGPGALSARAAIALLLPGAGGLDDLGLRVPQLQELGIRLMASVLSISAMMRIAVPPAGNSSESTQQDLEEAPSQ